MMLTDVVGQELGQGRADTNCLCPLAGKTEAIIWRHVHSQVLQLIPAVDWGIYRGLSSQEVCRLLT